jgi:hypothetical protein
MIVTDFGSVHSGAKFSPIARLSGPSTGGEGAYDQAMKAFARRADKLSTQSTAPIHSAAPVGDALIWALRSPAHAAPVLRPIADELEARRARG